jgi:peptidoglycan-associated lipoprotein
LKNQYAAEQPLVYLYLGNALAMQGKYREAIGMYDQYLGKAPGDRLALAGKASCELSLADTLDDPRWIVRNIRELNSEADDFSAAYGDSKFSTVIFSSNRKGTTGNDKDTWTEGYFSDLFLATKKKRDNRFDTPSLLDARGIVNTIANEGASAPDPGYKILLFTRCEQVETGKDYCKILQSGKMGAGWGKPLVIYADTLANAGHPAITSDRLTLYFTSSRPGGSGGKDLWKTSRPSERKPFGPPENLGPAINTPGDEMFPTLLADSVLYFSSNGKTGYGGLDIYRVTMGKNGVLPVEHLPHPVNSPADDFAMNFEAGNQRGFFTSRRKGGKGGDDIYWFEWKNPRTIISGTVKDAVTLNPMAKLQVMLVGDRKDTTRVVTNDQGEFEITPMVLREQRMFTITVEMDHYFTWKKDFTPGTYSRDTTCHFDLLLQPIPDKPIVLPDVYYEVDHWDIRQPYQDSLMVLVNMLQDNPKIRIELASHTDSRASDQYNDELSQKRAEAVVLFLTEKGIDKERLVAKGYGKRVPRVLTADITRDGYVFSRGTLLSEAYILSIDDPKKRETAYQLNRRTEFTVLLKE